MRFIEKFKAGFEQGIKARVSHPVRVSRAKKDVYKSTEKWEKKAAKEAKKAEKRNHA